MEGGHGFKLGTEQDMRAKADIFAFIQSQTTDKTRKPF
jgi:hypothetical protein